MHGQEEVRSSHDWGVHGLPSGTSIVKNQDLDGLNRGERLESKFSEIEGDGRKVLFYEVIFYQAP